MGWSQHHPVGLIYSAPQHCFRGYTLTTNNRGHHARLIDLEGRVCHQWQSDQGIGYAYLLPSGNLLLRTRPPEDAGGAETIGGSSAAILELDWDSNVVWEYQNPYLHHDYERLPNGNTLVLLFELLSPELTAAVQGGRPTDEDPANECLGTKAQVQEKMYVFFGGPAHRKDEVKHRCRTLLQARADALMMKTATPLPSLQNVVPTLALV